MEKEKICFVIMPISDQEGYEPGHFNRVYEHLIKPSCIKAGFTPIRADEENKTNYIVIDILRKIIESDMVLCDLSAKNPNVLYELGIRQAFNKKTVLIKDKKTARIFDIQGLRTIDYDETLRIDSVQNNTESISKCLQETNDFKGNEINSLVQLLSIKPAKLSDNLELSNESLLILKAIEDVHKRISLIEKNSTKSAPAFRSQTDDKFAFKINGEKIDIGDELFLKGNSMGILIGYDPDAIYLQNNGTSRKILRTHSDFPSLTALPF
jgi:hypothetical protein